MGRLKSPLPHKRNYPKIDTAGSLERSIEQYLPSTPYRFPCDFLLLRFPDIWSPVVSAPGMYTLYSTILAGTHCTVQYWQIYTVQYNTGRYTLYSKILEGTHCTIQTSL